MKTKPSAQPATAAEVENAYQQQLEFIKVATDSVIGELETQNNMMRTRATQLAREIGALKTQLKIAGQQNQSLLGTVQQHAKEIEDLRASLIKAEGAEA